MNRRSSKGYTLIELLIVVAIIAIISSSLMAARDFNIKHQRRTSDMQKAAWIMQSQAEKIRSRPFTALRETAGEEYGVEQKQAMGMHCGKGMFTIRRISTGLKRIDLTYQCGDRTLDMTFYRAKP